MGNKKKNRTGKITGSTLLIMLSIFLFSACIPEETDNVHIKFWVKGREAFSKKNFDRAVPYFRKVAFEKMIQSDLTGYALIYLSLSYYHLWDLENAEKNFQIFLKAKKGGVFQVFENLRGKGNQELISEIYLSLIKGKQAEALRLAQKLLNEAALGEKKLNIEQIFMIHHVLYLNGDCADFYLLGKALENFIGNLGKEEARELLKEPLFGIGALDCFIVHRNKGAESKNWQKEALGFIQKLDNKKEPSISLFYGELLDAYKSLLLGDFVKAEAKGEKLLKKNPNQESLSFMVRLLELKGNFAELRLFMDRHAPRFGSEPVDQYKLASYYSVARDKAKALQFLENALNQGFRDLAHMKSDPYLNFIRGTAEFQNLIRKIFTIKKKAGK
jgi:hypothetical protein